MANNLDRTKNLLTMPIGSKKTAGIMLVLFFIVAVVEIGFTQTHVLFNLAAVNYLQYQLKGYANSPRFSDLFYQHIRLNQALGQDGAWVLSTSDDAAGRPRQICEAYLQRRWLFWMNVSGSCGSGLTLPHDPLVIAGGVKASLLAADSMMTYGFIGDLNIAQLQVKLNDGQSIVAQVRNGAFLIVYPPGVVEPTLLDENTLKQKLYPVTVDVLDKTGRSLYQFDYRQLTPLRKPPPA